jgi:hypothetical protein
MGLSRKGAREAARGFDDVRSFGLSCDCVGKCVSVFLCFWLGEKMRGRFMPSYIDPVICLSLARI